MGNNNRTNYKSKRNYWNKKKGQSYKSAGGGKIVNFTNSSPLPIKFKAVLRYSSPYQTIPIPADTLLGARIYSCNGIYDPDITGIGHQPSGFDQLMLMYDHFVVIGAKLIVTFVNQDTSDSIICGIDVRDSINAEPDVRIIIESGTAKYINLSERSSGQNQTTMTYKVNPAKFLGRSNPLSDPQLKGSSGGNPTEQCYFHIFAGNLDDQGILGTECIANICIEYQVVFIEPKPVGLS